jgi:hypothetical protein
VRNYIQTFYARVEWDFDPTPPDPPTHRQLYVNAPSDLELTQQIALFIEGLQSDPDNKNITVPIRGPVYWLMDKYNLFFALDKSGIELKLLGFTIPWLMFPGENNEPNPREGWKDAAGVERKPTPSDKGAGFTSLSAHNVQVSFITGIGILIQQLTALGFTALAKQLSDLAGKIILGEPVDPAKWEALLALVKQVLGI